MYMIPITIKLKKQIFRQKIIYQYDNRNRLIKKTIKDVKNEYSENYAYDLKNNKISATDIYGNTTYYKYDAFNNLIEEILPSVQDPLGNFVNPSKSYQYDDLNRQIEKQNPYTILLNNL